MRHATSSGFTFPPIAIEVLLHAYTTPAPMPRSSAHEEWVRTFTREGFIEYTVDGYKVTDKGLAWVKRICSTEPEALLTADYSESPFYSPFYALLCGNSNLIYANERYGTHREARETAMKRVLQGRHPRGLHLLKSLEKLELEPPKPQEPTVLITAYDNHIDYIPDMHTETRP